MIGMSGRLRLVVGLDGLGRCALREQFDSQLHRVLQLIPGRAPQEGLVYLLNPTGGIVQGDDLEADIRVEAGAHAIVTSPSATRIYGMDRGEAFSRTRLRVGTGAVLEYLPEPLIPYAGARFVEDLELEAEPGARALAWEILSPGRRARGESLAYERLEFRLKVREGGQTVLRERSVIVPAAGLGGPVVLSRFTHYGILITIGGDPAEVERAARSAMGTAFGGATRLRGSAVVVKILADELRDITALFDRLRGAVIPILAGREATSLRRT
jgi:urease accessory protein